MDAAAQPSPVTVAVAGSRGERDAVAAALRSIDGVSVNLTGPGEDDLLQALSDADVDAIAFASPVVDLPGAIRRALMSRRHALVARHVSLASKQLLALDELAHRRERALVFDDGVTGNDALSFVRKMTSGPNALWRPRYVRALRTGIHGDETVDELAMTSISGVLAIMGSPPARVSAIAPRIDDESGASSAAMITLAFDGGAVARIDVSCIEPQLRHETIIACDGRTIVLDALDQRAPLQIQASGRYRGPQTHSDWAETVSEHPLATSVDQAARFAQSFVTAVRGRDLVASNAAGLATTAAVWETARESIARGGDMVDMAAHEADAAPSRPELQLIHGGGHHVESAAPELTLVRRTATRDSGPRSA